VRWLRAPRHRIGWQSLTGVLAIALVAVMATSGSEYPSADYPHADPEEIVNTALKNTSALKAYATRTVESGWTGYGFDRKTFRTTESWIAPGDRTYSRTVSFGERSEVVVYESGSGFSGIRAYRRVGTGAWKELSFRDIGFDLDAAVVSDLPARSQFELIGEATRDGVRVIHVRKRVDVRAFADMASVTVPGSPVDRALSSGKLTRMSIDYYIQWGRPALHTVITTGDFVYEGAKGHWSSVKQYWRYPYPPDWPPDLPPR
jgi:hypothetical protein